MEIVGVAGCLNFKKGENYTEYYIIINNNFILSKIVTTIIC